MDVTQLGLGGQTVKSFHRLAFKFDLDQSVRSQALAKRGHKQTKVFNLRLLASPFGQGLT